MSEHKPRLPDDIPASVAQALAEDIGRGDLTATLVDAAERGEARILVRESAVLCGAAWVDEVFRQLDGSTRVEWAHADGAQLSAGTTVCRITGPTRALLSGERTALNFLQLLSATATQTAAYVREVAGSAARILDTRKTIPGLRLAQKYAVRCGGGSNHRIGLYDAVLIKENHIAAAGEIGAAVAAAKAHAGGKMIELEVESLGQLTEALMAPVDRLLLDNFELADIREAVRLRDAAGKTDVELEASGGITLAELRDVAATGVDFISIGAITKNIAAIDYSMRVS